MIPIITDPSRLRQESRTVSKSDIGSETINLINLSLRKLVQHHRVPGLTASQIGFPLALMVVEIEGKHQTVINPRIIEESATLVTEYEVCLCFPGLCKIMARPLMVEVEYTDLRGIRVRKILKNRDSANFSRLYDYLLGKILYDR